MWPPAPPPDSKIGEHPVLLSPSLFHHSRVTCVRFTPTAVFLVLFGRRIRRQVTSCRRGHQTNQLNDNEAPQSTPMTSNDNRRSGLPIRNLSQCHREEVGSTEGGGGRRGECFQVRSNTLDRMDHSTQEPTNLASDNRYTKNRLTGAPGLLFSLKVRDSLAVIQL